MSGEYLQLSVNSPPSLQMKLQIWPAPHTSHLTSHLLFTLRLGQILPLNVTGTEHVVLRGLVVLLQRLQLLGRRSADVGEDVLLTGKAAARLLLRHVVHVEVHVNFVLFHHS